MIAACALAAAAPAAAAASVPPVAVFPIPGSRMATPQTQIAFRGLPASRLGQIVVVGSHSGTHTGRVLGDSDGDGGSFIPTTPFTPGEVVTVKTHLRILRAPSGTFRFTIDLPVYPIVAPPRSRAPRVPGDVWHFRSRPDLSPAALKVTLHSSGTAPGDIFLAPQRGPLQWGPMIVDPHGHLVFFDPLPGNQMTTDFRVQSYRGRPVLTWWQGQVGGGVGDGEDVIADTSYRTVAVVHAANGLQSDLHEFELTPQGTALITAFHPVRWAVKGSRAHYVVDAVVQEIDIPTGLLLFQWNSLDHVPIADSYAPPPPSPSTYYDYIHVNSIQKDDDGNFIISARNTSTAYKVDHRTGAVIWRLGGKHSSFRIASGAKFAFQHDVRIVAHGDQFMTVFDDGGGVDKTGGGVLRFTSQSRGLKLLLDFKHMTVTRVQEYVHLGSPLAADFEGNDQQLPNLNDFIGWGQLPYFSEFTAGGREIYDGHFLDDNSVYRSYRFVWHAQPATPPAAVVSRDADGVSTVYVSWNGATDVATWRVIAGFSSHKLHTVATAPKRDFETAIRVYGEQPYFAVEALSSRGRVIATSRVLGSTLSRVSIFGHTAFVSPGGIGQLQVGCFSRRPCRLRARLTAQKSVVAMTRPETIPANSGGSLFFDLTSAGSALLRNGRGRLAVSASIYNVDGSASASGLQLVALGRSGPRVPSRSPGTRQLRIISQRLFVSPAGAGGVFVACRTDSPCSARTTITVHGSTIAQTGPQKIAGRDLGMLAFRLTRAGRAMLAGARGNQLPAVVRVRTAHSSTAQSVLLVLFH